MQAYKSLQCIKYWSKNYKKEKMYFQKLKVFFNSKVKDLKKSK